MNPTLDKQRIYLTRLVNDFPYFVEESLKFIGLKPSNIQLEMANHLTCGEERIAIFASRGYAKTYLACLYVCWRFLRNRHLKVKVISNSYTRATEITGQILHFIKNIPFLSFLTPERLNAGRTRFNVAGAMIEKDYSLHAISVESKNTGGRADLVIADDVEAEDCNTTDKRNTVLTSVQEVSAVLHPQETRFFNRKWIDKNLTIPKPDRTVFVCLGTYATVNSIYLIPEDESTPHFLRGASIRKWAALDTEGNSTFPERFSTEYLRNVRDKYVSTTYWALQYMLDPTLIVGSACPWKIEKIKEFAIDEQRLPQMFAFIDPSSGGDYTVCVIGGIWNKKLYIHDILSYKDVASDESFASICDYIKANKEVKHVVIESNIQGYQVVFKNIMKQKGVIANVGEYRAKGDKHTRTLETLEPLLNSGDIVFCKKLLYNNLLMKEMAAWTFTELPSGACHDDFMDAISSFARVNLEKIGRGQCKIAYGSSM